MIGKVYIQKLCGEFPNIGTYVAWYGFGVKQYKIVFFEWSDLEQGKIEISKNSLIVGGMGTVKFAFRKLGVENLNALNIPEQLIKYCDRKIWKTTMKELKVEYKYESIENIEKEPVFIKPYYEPKLFTGFILKNSLDLIKIDTIEDQTDILVSEYVDIITESRYYIHKGKVIGVGQYKGDHFIYPQKEVVLNAINDYIDQPIAYSLDFGVTKDGRTVLIEAQDAYALGCYGLPPRKYANMLEDRWVEIMEKHSA